MAWDRIENIPLPLHVATPLLVVHQAARLVPLARWRADVGDYLLVVMPRHALEQAAQAEAQDTCPQPVHPVGRRGTQVAGLLFPASVDLLPKHVVPIEPAVDVLQLLDHAADMGAVPDF